MTNITANIDEQYLSFNGRELSREKYPELYRAIESYSAGGAYVPTDQIIEELNNPHTPLCRVLILTSTLKMRYTALEEFFRHAEHMMHSGLPAQEIERTKCIKTLLSTDFMKRD